MSLAPDARCREDAAIMGMRGEDAVERRVKPRFAQQRQGGIIKAEKPVAFAFSARISMQPFRCGYLVGPCA